MGLSLTFGPHADIVQKTTSRRTVEMVVKQLVSLETTETLFFFSLPLPPLLYRTFLRCSAFFRGPFIDCPSFFLVLYSCVTLLLLFYSKYVQLIARVVFSCLLDCTWLDALIACSGDGVVRQSYCIFTFRLVKDLCRLFPSFARAHKHGFGLCYFFFLMECISPSLFHFVQNMSDAGNTGRCASDVCGVKQKYGLSFLLQRPKCAARLPE